MSRPSINRGFRLATNNDAILAALLHHEEDNFLKLTVENNLEEKEHMIMRGGELATIMQHQEEDEAQKSKDKEQRSMTSTPTGKALILVWRVLSLHQFLSLPYPRTWLSPQKKQPWKWIVCFFLRIV